MSVQGTKISDIVLPEGFDRSKLQGTPYKATRIEEEPGFLIINKNWYFVLNSKKPELEDNLWNKYGFSLIYVPNKLICEVGHHEEMKEAENTKKRIVTVLSCCLAGGLFLSIPFLPKISFTAIYEVARSFFFSEKL